MGVKLVSSGGGSVEINPPATASSFTATMPAGTGTVAVNGVSGTLVSGTAVASTSGTSIDFTGIPSWVKRITVMFSGVSTNGTSNFTIRLGDGSINTSGYLGSSSYATVSGNGYASGINYSTGFEIISGAATIILYGAITFTLLGSNTWACSGNLGRSDAAVTYLIGGSKTLSGTLDRIRITTVNGTDTFDAGSINILYE